MGAPLRRLAGLVGEAGPPSARGIPALSLAFAVAALRAPVGALERAWCRRREAAPVPAPVFIVGHWRSGTTHLYNILAEDPRFATVSPLAAGLPLEYLLLARPLAPLLKPTLPRERFIDAMPVEADSPQEDEIAIAAMGGPSFLDAFLFPRRFETLLGRGLFLDDADAALIEGWWRRLEALYAKLLMAQPGTTLLIKNPVYTARIARLVERWPDARFIHIHRDADEVRASTAALYRSMFDNFALQAFDHVAVERVVDATYDRMMRRFEADRARLSPGQLAEIGLSDLAARPRATLERVYDTLSLPGFAEVWPRFARHIEAAAEHRRRHRAGAEASAAAAAD